MGKLAVLVLLLAALVVGVIYYMNMQNKPEPVKPVSTTAPTTQTYTTPTPTPSVTDETIDADITALDRDLIELNQSDKGLMQDINSL